MNTTITGKTFTFGKNIDTDQIYPGRFVEFTDIPDIIKHTMEGADPNFVKEFQKGDVIVAGSNFGCGSSREHAAICLKEIGVGAVVADSFARIFYRNAINLGLPLIICPNITEKVQAGDKLSIDIKNGQIKKDNEVIATAEALSEYSLNILQNGGIKNIIRKQLQNK